MNLSWLLQARITSCWPCTTCLTRSASNIPFKPNWSNCGISLACPTRRHRRSLEFRCPPLIIIGISLAPGCSRKSEGNKFILLAEGLEFSPRILVYLHVDVHPDMESRPKQIRTQTGPFILPNRRRGKNLNALLTLQTSELDNCGAMGLTRVVRTLPCPEVI